MPVPPRSTRPLAGVLALLLASLCACGGRSGSDTDREVGHGILLIAVDGLRADHLGCLGHDRDTSPHIDALADRGVVFSAALSTAPSFVPSMASLLSGCDPNMARRTLPGMGAERIARQWELPKELPSLPVELAVAGYRTAAFVDSDTFEGSIGLDRGFQEVRRIADDWERRERGPLDLAADWVRAQDIEDDWFCLVQLDDLLRAFEEPHPEWDSFFEGREDLQWVPPVGANETNFHAIPPARWEGGTVPMARYDARYDGAIRKLDAALQRLFDRLEGGGRYKRTSVCLIGTHGLQLGEAGLLIDNGLLSPMDVHVPLIVRPATRLESAYEEGLERDSIVASMDVAPTLLELAKVASPTPMHGLSLVERLFGPADPAHRERVVVVSCGTITGSAAYGDELVVEHLVPGFETNDTLRDQWLGRPVAGRPVAQLLEVRSYLWRGRDVHPLQATPVAPPGYEEQRALLSAVQDSWFMTFVVPEHTRMWGAR